MVLKSERQNHGEPNFDSVKKLMCLHARGFVSVKN